MDNIKKIPFSPPDITDAEIDAVMEVLKSGWITSGPRLANFEKELAEYCQVYNSVALNSATAAMELILKVLDIKEGDEIITTPYTYTATASVALHRGIKPIFADVKKESFFIDEDKVAKLITDKTKVIMPVDFAGMPYDYDALKKVLKEKNREDIIILCDSAHSFGAKYKGKTVGGQCDFHCFSFHAVKNLTTAEGGAITYNNNNVYGIENLFQDLKYTSLHGQSKDALAKTKPGAWEYDIITDGYKCNMTDISAAIGSVQLKRYDNMLKIRKEIFNAYTEILSKEDFNIIPETHREDGTESSYHLYPLRIKGFNEDQRNELIKNMANLGISTNVHFKPLPMFTLYKNLGYNIEDYPNAYNQYCNEISLPVYSTLDIEDVKYIAKNINEQVKKILAK